MNTLGCLDRPTSGIYRLNGVNVSELSDLERARMRLLEIGFVFQSFNLLPRLTAIENVELPLVVRRRARRSPPPAGRANARASSVWATEWTTALPS